MNLNKNALTELNKLQQVAISKKQVLAVIKILVGIALIYFLSTKIDLKTCISLIGKSKWEYLILALLFFVISKGIASYRLNLYFHQLNVPLTQLSNLKLYLLGMFYNLFLPGGIGGDAYKGYLINKKFNTGGKKVAAGLILDRLSGMLVLFLLACVLSLVLPFSREYSTFIIIGMLLSILIFWLGCRKLFNTFTPIFWHSFMYSFGVQLLQLICVWCILKALNVEHLQLAYLLIFLISSIVAVIPLTLGGIGSRELTFFYGATLLHLQEDVSISISVTFFIITAFTSLFGIIYLFKQPKLTLAS